ncbi:MAG TPA: VOC family protein [Gemmatimonadales bacterium]|jgi:catechol-2,3-dioxygenase|nr:VOC family protein [Gemmatimonadales bacterium]HZA97981.1 VOC family protein [Gemmatimonadales bacterium]
MLGAKEAMATVAVRDLEKAKKFYEGTLGLTLTDAQEQEALTYRAAGTKLLVYRSQYAGSNKATAATWLIGNDIEKVVQSLKAKGVAFEHYNMPGMTLKGDIHVADGMKAAWFKDPDGNIHALVSG